MSYERGTLVVSELAETLSRLPSEGRFPALANGNSDQDSFSSEWQKNCTPINLFPIQNNCSDDLEADGVSIRNLLRDDRAFAEIFGHGVYGSDRGNSSFSEMAEYFSSVELPLGFLENLRYERKGDSGFHGELDRSVETHVCTSMIAGNEVLVVFARTDDRPDQWWVEDIRFVENSVSSWGFLRYQINAGSLASKPTEYHHQCPWFADSVSNPEGIGKETKKGSGYIDIRPFVQSNPLIRKFADSVYPSERE